MLVLTRKRQQTIVIDGDIIKVQILEINGDQVKVGITAPDHISVHREEVFQRIQKAIDDGGKP